MTPSEAFRRSVVRLRKRYGWRQVDLAKRAGLSRDALKGIESGGRRITVDEMFAISAALGASPAHLVAPGGGADLEVLDGEVVRAHVFRAWHSGSGFVRPDDLPHMPAAFHHDDWERRIETSTRFERQRVQQLLDALDELIEMLGPFDPGSELARALTAAGDRLDALNEAIAETSRAVVQRNDARAAAKRRVRRAA